MIRYRVFTEQVSSNPYERTWFAQHRGWFTLWMWTDIDGHWEGYATDEGASAALDRAMPKRPPSLTDGEWLNRVSAMLEWENPPDDLL